MRKSVKTILLAIVMIAVSIGILGTNSWSATEIQWWHAMGGVNGERVNKIADDFNATQSEYKVVPVYKGNYTETMTAAIASFRAKKHPHIVQVFEVGTATMMAAEGAVYPVEQMMKDAGEKIDKSAFLPAVISYYQTPKGELLSMPFNSSTPVLWYNVDAFAKAGIKAPPKTWPEMEEASKKLLAAGYKSGFSFGWQSWVMVENFSAWHNLAIGTKENGFAGIDTEFTFNNEKVKRLMEDVARWQKSKVFDYGGIKKQAKFKFDQAMLPYYPDIIAKPQNSIIGGATLWVLKGHDKGDYKGVAKFMTYLASPEVQAWWHQETGYVPITTAAYELSKKQGFYEKNPGTDMAIKQLSLNTPTPNSKGIRFGNFVQVRDIINEEMEAMWNGSKTASQALDDAVARGNKLLRKFEKANR